MSKIVAIDGPAGSGKGTIASLIAKECNLVYIDTGATYRCVALAVLNKKIPFEDKDAIIDLSKDIDIKFGLDGKVYLYGEDVSKDIRTMEVTKNASKISCIPEVRTNMVDLQRRLAGSNDCIMEGRDITTVVFPNAEYKFYLDASLEERARRRVEQNKQKGLETNYDEIYNSMKERDYNDMHKEVGSLMRTDEQIYIDTTNMTIDDVVNKIVSIVKGE